MILSLDKKRTADQNSGAKYQSYGDICKKYRPYNFHTHFLYLKNLLPSNL